MYLILMIICTLFFIFVDFKCLSNNSKDIFSNKKYIEKLENTTIPEEFIKLYQDIEENCNVQLSMIREKLIAIIVITVLVIFVVNFIFSAISDLIVFCVIVIGIVCYAINKMKYIKIYKDNFVNSFINYMNPNLKYKPEGDNNKTRKLYEEAKFDNKFFNRFYVDDYISGVIDNNINIKLCDISIENSGGKHTRIIKRGLFTYIESSAKLPEEVIINTHNINSRNDNKVELDNEEFETYYNIYCSSKILTYQVFTHDVMDELINFYKEFNVDFEIVLKDNKVYMMFHTGKMFEPKIFSTKNNVQILWTYYNVTNFIINFITKINKELQNLNI